MSEPPITVLAGGYWHSPRTAVNLIVTHDEEYPVKITSAEDIANYFHNSSAGSTHYVIDADSEQHCVPEANPGYANTYCNFTSIDTELNGYATFTRGTWLDNGQAERTIARHCARDAELAVRHGVPIVKLNSAQIKAGARGFCGHIDITYAYASSGHTDPGTQYPWDIAIATTQAIANMINTDAKVKAFQSSHGLTADGDIGPATIKVLGDVAWDVLKGIKGNPAPAPAPAPAPKPTGNINRFSGEPEVAQGATGPAVKDLQNALNLAVVPGFTPLVVDGMFGPGTRGAVVQYQKNRRLTADGIVGPATWHDLGALITSRGH